MPVGPEFQDPSPPQEQLPYFVALSGGDGSPGYETTVTLSGMQRFAGTAGDPNLDDTLSARWVANYPPISSATNLIMTMVGNRGTADHNAKFAIMVSCDDFKGGADHNLVLIVSDRGFIAPEQWPSGIASSQVPYNYDDQPTQQIVTTMTGWRIAGCP